MSQFRAREILHAIFDALGKDQRLLPGDTRTVYARVADDQKARVVWDFIAGMTDGNAVEFYGRIRSENPQTISSPSDRSACAGTQQCLHPQYAYAYPCSCACPTATIPDGTMCELPITLASISL